MMKANYPFLAMSAIPNYGRTNNLVASGEFNRILGAFPARANSGRWTTRNCRRGRIGRAGEQRGRRSGIGNGERLRCALRQVWDVELFDYTLFTRARLPLIEQRGCGDIAKVIGSAGAAPMFFTQANGGAGVRSRVRVFGIKPSATSSNGMETLMCAQAEKRLGDTGQWIKLTSHTPLGRLMEPREMAKFTVLCCALLAAYLSGTVINLDGGQMYAIAK